jgi:hypothetical protein
MSTQSLPSEVTRRQTARFSAGEQVNYLDRPIVEQRGKLKYERRSKLTYERLGKLKY